MRITSVALTAAIAIVAVIATMLPEFGSLLEYDRAAIAAGAWWRLICGHLAHWGVSHLFWDLWVFVGLGMLCERLHRPRFIACVAGAAVLIPLTIWFSLPEMVRYRGLSGIDSALLVLLAVHVWRRGWRARGTGTAAGSGRLPMALAGGFLAAFLGKTVYEWMTGQCLFVNAGGVFVPVPLAHLAGAAAGLIAGMIGRASGPR